jgi:hypothetical protein
MYYNNFYQEREEDEEEEDEFLPYMDIQDGVSMLT